MDRISYVHCFYNISLNLLFSCNSYSRHGIFTNYCAWEKSGQSTCKENKKFCLPCPRAMKSDGSAHQQVACCTQKHTGHVNPLGGHLRLLFSVYISGSCFPFHAGTKVHPDFVINLIFGLWK